MVRIVLPVPANGITVARDSPDAAGLAPNTSAHARWPRGNSD